MLQAISKALIGVGMKLGASKTALTRNVVAGSIKSDKIAGIALQSMDFENAKTMQKQLLRLHTFGQLFPNSGALRRLISDFHTRMSTIPADRTDLEVRVAIVTDIAFRSPSTFPAVAGILSYLLKEVDTEQKLMMWRKVREKMRRVPYNGYLELWLQRVTRPFLPELIFESDEPLCKIMDGTPMMLWNSDWLEDTSPLHNIMDVNALVTSDPADVAEVVAPSEVSLFRRNALAY